MPPKSGNPPGARSYHVLTGWTRVAQQLEEATQREPRLSQFGRVQIPTVFTLVWIESDPQDAEDARFLIELLFEVVNSSLELRHVISWPMEVPEAMSMLRAQMSINEWKRLALSMLFADDAEFSIGLNEKIGWALSDEEKSDMVSEAIRHSFEVPVSRRRNRVTDEHLAEVAEVYRRAWHDGRSPTDAVRVEFSTSHSTAARWVGLARKRGLLGESQGTRGGEVVDQDEQED